MPNKKKVEVTGNKIRVTKSDELAALEAIFVKASPTNKDVITVLKALYERG